MLVYKSCRFETLICVPDGVPPVTQTQHLPHEVEGLPALTGAGANHRHVLFHWLFITVTRRSLQLAISSSCLTFATLQVSQGLSKLYASKCSYTEQPLLWVSCCLSWEFYHLDNLYQTWLSELSFPTYGSAFCLSSNHFLIQIVPY